MTISPPAGVCGPETGLVCGWVFEATGGNGPLAAAADWAVGRPLAIAGVFFSGWVLRWIIGRLVARGVNRMLARGPMLMVAAAPADQDERAGVPLREDARRTTRAAAVAGAVSSLLAALVWVGVLISVAGILGVDLGPLIASAGLAGVALAFGAQSLIQDLLGGLFILLEDHFGLGDEVDLGEAVGTVEKMTLRETVLRDIDGTVWHVHNSEIDRVGNHSQVWSAAMIDVTIARTADIAQARAVLYDAATAVSSREPYSATVLAAPDVLGVVALAADGVTLRLLVRTLAGRQFQLQRALLEEILVSFAAAGVELASQHVTVDLRPARPR